MSLIEVPFYNDFYSLISPENKDEIIEHCMNPENFQKRSISGEMNV